MEVPIDMMNGAWWHPDSAGLGEAGPPEWHALRARILAARDASRELTRTMASGPRGSFAQAAALRLSAYQSASLAVNPTDSVNRKRENARVETAAAPNRTGGRG